MLTHTLLVAITRAQSLLILVGDPEVLGKDNFWRTFLNYITLRNGSTGKVPGWRCTDPVPMPLIEAIPREHVLFGGRIYRREEREHLQVQPRRRLKMGVSRRREEIRSSVRMAFLTLAHVSYLHHRSHYFEVNVYASRVILNLICNRIFLYVRFIWRATRTHVLHFEVSPPM